ncbi:DoxX family membrane protein [bacterium]|nr:DoxX family membrane protein [bacterium]
MNGRDRTYWVLALLIRLVIGVTFIVASYHKILHPDAFAQSVYYYHMVPASLLHIFALYLPWLELVAGISLIIGCKAKGAAILTALMTLAFIVGLSTSLARNLDISCGCFGTDEGHSVGMSLLIRDIIMFGALGFFLWIERRKELLRA